MWTCDCDMLMIQKCLDREKRSGVSVDEQLSCSGQRARTRGEQQTANQSSCVQSEREHVSADVVVGETRTCCFLQSRCSITALTFHMMIQTFSLLVEFFCS